MKFLRFLAIFFLIFVSSFDLKSMKEGQQQPSSSSSSSYDNKSSAPSTYFGEPVPQNTRPVSENYGTVPTAPSSKPASLSKPTDYADFSNLSGTEGSQAPEASSSAFPVAQAGSLAPTTEAPSVGTSSSQREPHTWALSPKRPRAMTVSSHRNAPPKQTSQTSDYGQMPPASSSSSSSAQQGKFSGRDDAHFDISKLKEDMKKREESGEPEAPSFADQAAMLMPSAPQAEPSAPSTVEPSSGSSYAPTQQYEPSTQQFGTPNYGQLPPPTSYPPSEQPSQTSDYGEFPPSSSSSSAALQQVPLAEKTTYSDFSDLVQGPEAPSAVLPATQAVPSALTTETPSSSSSSSPTQQYEQQGKTPNYGPLPSSTSSPQTAVLPEPSSSSSSSVSPVASVSSSSSSSSSPEASLGFDINRFRENLKTFLNLPILENNTVATILKGQILKLKKLGCYGQLIAYIEELPSQLVEKHPDLKDLKLKIGKAASLYLTDQREINKIVGQLSFIVSNFTPELSQEQINLKEFVKAAGAKSDEIDNYIQPGFMSFLFEDKEGLIKNPLKEKMNQYLLLQMKQTVNHQKIEDSKDWKGMQKRLKKSLSEIRETYKAWEGKVKKLQAALQVLRDKILDKMSKKELDNLKKEKENIINKLVELEGKK